MTLSSPSSNPYADPQTPTRNGNANGSGNSQTPKSLVRNIFARPRTTSPLTTPTKRVSTSPGAVVLPPSKRSFTKWTPSPQEGESERSEPPSSPLRAEDAQVLTEIRAPAPRSETRPPPNAQKSPLLLSLTRKPLSPTILTSTRKHGLSPTAKNTAAMDATPTARPKKRVRLSSPTQPLVSTPPRASQTTAGSSAPELSLDAWTFRDTPPSKRDVVDSMAAYSLDTVEYQSVFYSNPLDVPARAKQFAGRVFHVKTDAVADLPEFEGEVKATPRPWLRKHREAGRAKFGWEFGPPPPTQRRVMEWCAKEDHQAALVAASQLAQPTQKNKHGFKLTQRSTRREQQNMSVLLLEVFGKWAAGSLDEARAS